MRYFGDRATMDKIIQIFVKLGVDQSIFYQFLIFAVIFFLLKTLFFNKLLFVLQTRESKTTKLEQGAGDKFKEADKLAKQFDEEVQKTNESVHHQMTNRKTSALKNIEEVQKTEEDKILKSFETKKAEIVASIESSKSEILSKADELSEKLVEKITN
jgi:F0F1-type ATP synthase membrane subunit b/b'